MSKEREALKLALEYLRDNQHYIADNERHVYVMEYNAFIEHLEALAEQPALPFGIGGGLVAIKTLLSRDPCAHAKTAIEMINAMLAEQPAQPCDMGAICLDCQPRGPNGECPDKQPAQQQKPMAWINWCAATGKRSVSFECESELASQPLYEGITQNTQAHYSKFHSWFDSELHRQKYTKDHPAYLAAQEAWNAANDAAQHRINRLNAEIEAWKVRFKIAEDALVKLNGREQKPVATMWQHGETGRTRITMPGDITDCDARWFKVSDLYTSPPASKPLTDEQIMEMYNEPRSDAEMIAFARAIEAAHQIKGDA